MKTWIKHSLAAVGTASLLVSAGVTGASADGDTKSKPKQKSVRTPAVERYYDTVRESAPGLPDHTVYRPADLSAFAPSTLPIVVWGNGACRNSNWGFVSTLTLLASHGFVVIAVGAPGARADASSGGTAQPERLTEAIDWALANNKREFRNRLDVDKVAAAGQSCGGIESLIAGADPRVKSVASVNSGLFATPFHGHTRDALKDLHTPTLFVNGGPSDVAYQNSIDNYDLVTVPALLVENSAAGHSGLWYGIRNGVGDTLMITAGVDLLTHWLDFTLNGTGASHQYLIAADCTLCSGGDWKVQRKGF